MLFRRTVIPADAVCRILKKMKLPRRAGYIVGGVVLALIIFGSDGFRKLFRRYWELHRLRTEIVQMKKENALLRREVYYLEEDTSYIERIARKELGLISPGEVEYRFKNN
jgi:cell division protein FtsB